MRLKCAALWGIVIIGPTVTILVALIAGEAVVATLVLLTIAARPIVLMGIIWPIVRIMMQTKELLRQRKSWRSVRLNANRPLKNVVQPVLLMKKVFRKL